jgi:hypothetical protein
MTSPALDEVRVRVTVDSDTPDLLRRLAGSKRQSREIVYLLRLGLQMEMMLSGKLPLFSGGADSAASLQGSGISTGTSGTTTASAAVPNAPSAGDKGGIPSGEAFSEMTGLDADYFSAPVSYAE